MIVSSRSLSVALCSGVVALGLTLWAQDAPKQLGSLVLPPGFHVEVFAENVGNAREMALGRRVPCSWDRSIPATCTP